MRHNKHRFSLGVKAAHREALMANLATALITHGKITTTLAKAKALAPFVAKIITLAKKAHALEKIPAMHKRRLAYARIRDIEAVDLLFDETVNQFLKRLGGYTRIYKLGARRGDGAEMGIIEFVAEDSKPYPKTKAASKPSKKAAPKKAKVVEEVAPKKTAPKKAKVVEEVAPKKATPKKTAPKKAKVVEEVASKEA